MTSTTSKNRMKKELEMFSNAPPPGISCAPSGDRLDLFFAQIIGASGTPYEGGVFDLEITIPARYPFDPPSIKFLTPIYHPNIDTSGRICLDTLKMPPEGSWRPCLNISTVLMMIRVLMAEPGSEDPLMADIWQEFKYDYTTYVEKAKRWTSLHASKDKICGQKGKTQHTVSKNQNPIQPEETSRVSKISSDENSTPATVSSSSSETKELPSFLTSKKNIRWGKNTKPKNEDNIGSEKSTHRRKENVAAPDSEETGTKSNNASSNEAKRNILSECDRNQKKLRLSTR